MAEYSLPILVSTAFCILLLGQVFGAALLRLRFPLPAATERYGTIDGLRGLLAISVVCHHFRIHSDVLAGGAWEDPASNLYTNMGAGAVALFFMITGLVFYPRIRRGFAQVDWVATYISRAFRILPLLTASILACAAIAFVRMYPHPDLSIARNLVHFAEWLSCWNQPPFFGYAQSARIDAYVLWSLRWEWLFYLLILPMGAWLGQAGWLRRRRLILPLALTIAPLLVARIAQDDPIRFVALFGAGMLCSEIGQVPAIRSILRTPIAGLVAGGALIAAAAMFRHPYMMPQLAVFGLFFATVVCGNRFAGLLGSDAARAIGECSFSIYILHGIVLDLLFATLARLRVMPSALEAAFILPLTVLVVLTLSTATYLLIERPFIALGQRLAQRVRPASRIGGIALEVAP